MGNETYIYICIYIYILEVFLSHGGTPNHPVVMDDHDLEDRFTQSVTLGDLPGSKDPQDFWEFTNLVVANKEPSFLVTLKCRPSVLNELYCLAVKKRCPLETQVNWDPTSVGRSHLPKAMCFKKTGKDMKGWHIHRFHGK